MATWLFGVLCNWRTWVVIASAVWLTILTYHIGFLFWVFIWLGLFIGMVLLLVVPIAMNIRLRTETYPKDEEAI